MSLTNYGVLKGHVLARRHAEVPFEHYNIHVIDQKNLQYRVAVNVHGLREPHDLEFCLVSDFNHPMTQDLHQLRFGFTEVDRAPGGIAMDYLRLDLIEPKDVEVLPFKLPGPDNDLNEYLDQTILKLIKDQDSVLYAFGERWGPQAKEDGVFGFTPSRGVHNVHMNQGSRHPFDGENGAWQDGALLAYVSSTDRWVGLFLKFQSQSWKLQERSVS